MSNVTLSQVLRAVRSANDAVSEVQRRVDAVDTANLMRLNFDDGVYDSSGDGSKYGYIITNTGMDMDLYASDDGTPTAGNYSEALAYGYYCKWDDDTSAPFATLSDGDATHSRIDTVYVNRFGVKVAEGTPAASPTAASIPTNALKLYEVTVPANETDGSGLTLTDSRTFLSLISDAYKSGGTDVAIADGGTGASTAAAARTNLGLEIGTDVLAQKTIGIANDNLLEVDDAAASSGEFCQFTANGIKGLSEAEFKAAANLEIGTDVLAQQTIGIANDNLVEMDDADAASGDFARFTANGLEGRSPDELWQEIFTESATAGEALSSGDVCYLKSDGKYWKTDASAAATAAGQLRIATESISADASGTFGKPGYKYTTTGLTAADEYWMSETAGAYTATQPTTSGAVVRLVGHAESTTVLRFDPSQTYIELA